MLGRSAPEELPGVRRPGRPRGSRGVSRSNRADALMAAALELFAERNFASVTIKDIAKATGVNTALIYYYFDNKKDLFQRTIENAVENAFAKFERSEGTPDDPAAVIASWLDNHLSLYDRIHKLVKVSLDYKGAPGKDAAIDRAIEQFYSREKQLLADCIRAGVEKNIFKPVKAETIAQFISTYLDGAMVRAVILPDFDLPDAVNDLRGIVWELLDYRPRG
jgi:AcrR family transcriptional regulator